MCPGILLTFLDVLHGYIETYVTSYFHFFCSKLYLFWLNLYPLVDLTSPIFIHPTIRNCPNVFPSLFFPQRYQFLLLRLPLNHARGWGGAFGSPDLGGLRLVPHFTVSCPTLCQWPAMDGTAPLAPWVSWFARQAWSILACRLLTKCCCSWSS